jgi:hypothetical protein
MARISQAMEELRYVTGNGARLYHTGQLDREGTIEYFQRYALSTRKRAEQSFRFINDPFDRSYIYTYTAGYDLLKAVGGAELRPLFIRLLTSQMLPSQLAAEAGQQSPQSSTT